MIYEVTIFKADTSEIVWQQTIEGDTKEKVAIMAESAIRAANIKGVMRVGKGFMNTGERLYTFSMKQLDSTVSKALDESIRREGGAARSKSSIKYNVANTTRIYIALNNKTDKDIIDHLEAVGNKQGYIKELIRKDISR